MEIGEKIKYGVFIFLLAFLATSAFYIFIFFEPETKIYYHEPKLSFWEVRSIDTMKYSRDLSREKARDQSFDKIIDEQIRNISETGATHAAIDTPYDEEFLPMLRRWVKAARKYKLNVWFRGNWSGWEEWFDYPKIDKDEHIEKTKNFILANNDLFEDGDIFSSCPECENGGSWDLSKSEDIKEYKDFIIKEYETAKSAFKKINKKTPSNFFSMNGDVARLIMDKETTASLDGIAVIDHYVNTSEKLTKDIKELARISGGKIVLGEIGAPIPDIHGKMTESEQAEWIKNSLRSLTEIKEVVGVNYWVSVGGSTQIWDSNGRELPGAKALRQFYSPNAVYGLIKDELGKPIANAKIAHSGNIAFSQNNGYFELLYIEDESSKFQISKEGYIDQEIQIEKVSGQTDIVLVKKNKSLNFKALEFLKKMIDN
jgi:hypothetical protein